MSAIVRVIGFNEETKQEVTAHVECATDEQYNDLLRRLNDAINAHLDWRSPGMYPLDIGREQTQGTLVQARKVPTP